MGRVNILLFIRKCTFKVTQMYFNNFKFFYAERLFFLFIILSYLFILHSTRKLVKFHVHGRQVSIQGAFLFGL